jgi:ABC-type branched-subunit amino acid transport system substrate-binding protein
MRPRAGGLRGEQCHRYTCHIVADVAMNVDAIGQWLFQNNRKRWHFVVAEDALGQDVYRRASRLLQTQGGTELGREVMRPDQPDYRLLLERVGQQDAEVIFVALRGEDLRQFLGQYSASGITALVSGAPLDMITVWSTPPAHVKGVWATSWYHQFERYSTRELNRRFLRRFGKPVEAYAWANWAAVKLVVEGILRTGSTDPAALVRYLEGAPAFDGHKGKALTFREWNHEMRQPMYIVQARDGPPKTLGMCSRSSVRCRPQRLVGSRCGPPGYPGRVISRHAVSPASFLTPRSFQRVRERKADDNQITCRSTESRAVARGSPDALRPGTLLWLWGHGAAQGLHL